MLCFEVITNIMFVNEIMPLQELETWNNILRSEERIGFGRWWLEVCGEKRAISKGKRKTNESNVCKTQKDEQVVHEMQKLSWLGPVAEGHYWQVQH